MPLESLRLFGLEFAISGPDGVYAKSRLAKGPRVERRAKLNAALEAPQGALSSKMYKHSTLTLERQIKRF